MTKATGAAQAENKRRAGAGVWPDRLLSGSGVLWFLTAAAGQWFFVYYIAAYYFPKLARDGLPGLAGTRLPHGHVPGDLAGNLAIAAHVVVAVIIIGGGPLQLMAPVRNRFPSFHRFVGRAYATTAVLTSLAGLYLVWTRGTVGGRIGQYAISLDAVLIILFAGIAVSFAVARDFDRHRRWAMRLFMVASAVWFFRVGLMFWYMTTGGVGIDSEAFAGPFITFLFFAQMAAPLFVLEVYFRAQDRGGAALKLAAAGLVLAATAVIGVGAVAAALGMWLPVLR